MSRREVLLGAALTGASLAACDGPIPDGPPAPGPVYPPESEPPEPSGPGNVRVSRDGFGMHGEPNLAVNPRDPRNLLGVCIVDGGAQGIAAYASFDGGATWRNHGVLADSDGGHDPTASFDAHGRGYLGASADDLRVWRTDDGGRTFARSVRATEGRKLDHPWLAADPTPGPPGSTQVYAAWTGGTDNDSLDFARSTDAGRSFAAHRTIDTGPGEQTLCCPSLAAGPAGAVHIAYGLWPPLAGGLRPQFPAPVRVISSTDHGQTWGPPTPLGIGVMEVRVVADTNVPALPAVVAHRQRRFAAVAYVARRSGAPFSDIVVSVSTDGGARWSTPRPVPRVDDGAIYTQPQLAIDEAGRLALSAFVHRGLMVDVAVLRAGPFSDRFGQPQVVTSRPFDPSVPAVPGKHGAWWMGDYQGLASAGGTVWPFWNDGRTGRLQIYTRAVPTAP
jgi:hypothetical protein